MASISERLTKQKAAIYIRVSTRFQVDKDSLQVQRRELIAYSEMVLGIPDYVVFEDAGFSAKNTDRPDYQRMMSRLRTGEFSHLLIWKVDRISRNLLDFASMYQELKELGIALVSKNEQFDTSSAMGEAMLKIVLVFAELERNMTAERVTAVMLSRANNGQWNGGRIPYGYRYDSQEKAILIDPVESKVVNLIWDTYEQYQSINYVVRKLNESNITTRDGNRWTTPSVHKILSSPFYVGDYVYNVHKEGRGYKKKDKDEWITVPDHHEPIISRDRFENIQLILKRNRRGGASDGQSYIKTNIHMFAGMLRCAKCGSNMSATLDKRRSNGWRPSLYGCARHRISVAQCPNKYVTDVVIGPFVFNYIANIIRAKNNIGEGSSTETLERKLLRGEAFAGVAHIAQEDLDDLLALLQSGKTGMEYKPRAVFADASNKVSEREILEDRHRKAEIALNRLKSLYLYGDEKTPEKDFIIERNRITSEMEQIEKRLSEIQNTEKPLSNDEMLKKASYFIMVENMLSDRYINYDKYIRKIDPSVPRNFLLTIIDRIEVDDGKIVSIAFKNGMKHRFIYK